MSVVFFIKRRFKHHQLSFHTVSKQRTTKDDFSKFFLKNGSHFLVDKHFPSYICIQCQTWIKVRCWDTKLRGMALNFHFRTINLYISIERESALKIRRLFSPKHPLFWKDEHKIANWFTEKQWKHHEFCPTLVLLAVGSLCIEHGGRALTNTYINMFLCELTSQRRALI